MFNFSSLCPNGSFQILNQDTETLGDCFVNTCILTPSNFVFCLINIYVAATLTDISRQLKKWTLTIMRFVVFFLIAISSAEFSLIYLMPSTHVTKADATNLIADLYKWIALVLHFYNVMNKNLFVNLYPIKLLCGLFYFAIANSIGAFNQLYSRNDYRSVDSMLMLAFFVLQMVYLIVILTTYSTGFKLERRQHDTQVNIQNTDTENLLQESDGSDESEEDMANYISYITFSWLKPVMEKAKKSGLKAVEDVSQLPVCLAIGGVCSGFMEKYLPNSDPNPIIEPSLLMDGQFMQNVARDLCQYDDDNISRYSNHRQPQSQFGRKHVTLLIALLKTFGVEFFGLGILKLFNDVLNFSGPLLLNQLVQFVETKGESLKIGCLYAIALFLTSFLSAIINIHFSNSMNKLTFRIKTVIIHVIYNKALLVKLNELNKYSIGQVVNYMSIDTDSVVNAFPSFHAFWSLPLQICISLYLLYSQIGLSFLVGVVFILILIPINKVISDYIGKVQSKLMFFKDLRVKLMTEFLYGIRVIKFYSWEAYFLKRINEIREKELQQLKAKKYLDAGCVYFWACTPILMSVATFTTYVLVGNTLSPSKVFTSLALFNMLINPLNSFPWVINGLVQAWVSLKRIQEFLGLENLSWLTYYSFNELSVISINPGLCIDIRDAQFYWKKSDNATNGSLESLPKIVLDQINIKVKRGDLIGIIGKVGSGKTTILHSIMAELEKSMGKVRIDSNLCSRGFAYVDQECWIKAGTIRQNILFGAPMNESFYREVLEACALTSDLNLFPKGDATFVGENGISLSGGQKARLALARACYANKMDLFLLDDPLSAVDVHVGKHIYDNCIQGLLKSKTRILCTHHYKHLVNADLVLVVDNGKIVQSGTGAQIISSYMAWFGKEPVTQVERDNATENNTTIKEKLVEQLKQIDQEDLKRQDDEEKEQGNISYQVYKYYCLSIGICLTSLTLLALFLMQASKNLTDLWLSYGTEHHHEMKSENGTDSSLFFIVYGCLCAANSVFTLFRAFFFAYSGILAGKYIHKRLIDSLSKGSLNFYQNTPSGRILNRLSSDMYAIDDSLPFILNIFLANLFGLVGMLAVTSYSLPWFSVSLVPLSIVYYNIQSYYRWTSRELKRLSSISLSPIYTHFHETLSGLTTIRAFRQANQFLAQNKQFLTDFIRASYVNMSASLWLSFRLQMISVVMIFVVGLTAVFQHIYSTANASLIGLALSYILNITGLLNGLIGSFTETEKEMVSVERAHQFERIDSEDWEGDKEVPENWPVLPEIEFNSVVLKYKSDGLNALNNVCFSIKAGEKIGVCGRTGSGKSSLFNALFRSMELASGVVRIGGRNIRELSLSVVRKSMSIIPQDPFIFNSTLRENLDPTGARNDQELWFALEKCRIDEKFRGPQSAGLDEIMEERGNNLSCGEKQLVCLARALLSARKILCIDEATASVDFETDQFIQDTIKSEFRQTTVITIAHRVQTILDYDRILVMNEGCVAEFDTVENLLANHQSLFYKLVNDRED